MNKIYIYFSLLITLSTFSKVNGMEKYFVTDGIRYHLLDATTVETCENPGVSYSGDIVIPSYVKCVSGEYYGYTYKVVRITGFNNCPELSSISIPSTVTSVGSFTNCTSLKAITIPDNVERWGGASGCTNLTAVNLGKGLKSICSNAFKECKSLTSISIPSNIEIIGESAFSGSGLKSISIPYGVKKICSYAFHQCDNLTSLSISSTVIEIEDHICSGCRSLSSIKVNSGNQLYDSRENCNAIIETIPNKLIVGCKNSIIPETTKIIGQSSFETISELSSITIPGSVTAIEDYAFNCCTSLISVNIPSSVSSIGEGAFRYTALKELRLSDGIKEIGKDAFAHCWLLTTISIPKSVEIIAGNVFYDCYDLQSISVDQGNSKYDSRANSNAIIDTETNHLIVGCNQTIIPNTVLSIGDYAFYNMKIKTITIPDNITSIGKYAFCDNVYLHTIILPNSITTIGASAFSGSGIEEIALPKSITSLDNFVFAGCYLLKKVVMPDLCMEIGEGAFEGCSNLQNIDIPKNTSTIGKRSFNKCQSLKSVVLPNELTEIKEYSFANCTNLESVTMSEKLEKINNYSFYNSLRMQDIYIRCETPPSATDKSFNSPNYKYVTLHVPEGCLDRYKNASIWKYFVNITEFESSAIAPTYSTNEGKEVRLYDIGGYRLLYPKSGLNIIRMSDGTTKKVFVK